MKLENLEVKLRNKIKRNKSALLNGNIITISEGLYATTINGNSCKAPRLLTIIKLILGFYNI